MRRRAWRLAMVVVAVVGFVGMARAASAVPPGSVGPGNSGYLVTFAARQCSSYTDVRANRARNDLMESLENLGPDSNYASGEPVNPTKEDAAPQSNCVPLEGWRFTMGTSTVAGNPQDPSVVTNPDATSIVTKANETLRDPEGNDVGSIAGAVTIELTSGQLARVQNRQVWVQGGTPTDPLLNGVFPGKYAFAALRCAMDNWYGDNVEWVGFPTGQSHVFCYAYYVTPPPESGTIVVRKQVTGAGTGSTVTFPFSGTVSYNPGGAFELTVDNGQPASQTFFRADNTPWVVTEDPVAGWVPTDGSPSCTAEGGSQVSIDGLTATIRLVGGDTVTCTYTNEGSIDGLLAVQKRTVGATGGPFGFRVTQPTGQVQTAAAQTTQDGVPVTAATFSTRGTYTITEDLPGSWTLTDVNCGGVSIPIMDNSVTVTVDTQPTACVFTNTLTGSITIRKVTQGGIGTFTFVVASADTRAFGPTPAVVKATTTQPGVPVTATGDNLTGLPLGTYAVIEIPPPATANGVWNATTLDCDSPDVTPADPFGAVGQLTPEHPNVTCTVTNVFDPPGTLQVVKQVEGDPNGRSADVNVNVECADGTTASLTLSASDPGPAELPSPLQFTGASTCTVTETASGVAPGASVDTTTHATSNGEPIASGGPTITDVAVGPNTEVVVTVTDTYTAASTPPPTTTPPTTSPPTTPPSTTAPPTTVPTVTSPLARTGVPTGMAVATALAILAAGLALVGTSRLASRRWTLRRTR